VGPYRRVYDSAVIHALRSFADSSAIVALTADLAVAAWPAC
jgi:hypothetical protein